jgi:hypothetical protein
MISCCPIVLAHRGIDRKRIFTRNPKGTVKAPRLPIRWAAPGNRKNRRVDHHGCVRLTPLVVVGRPEIELQQDFSRPIDAFQHQTSREGDIKLYGMAFRNTMVGAGEHGPQIYDCGR